MRTGGRRWVNNLEAFALCALAYNACKVAGQTPTSSKKTTTRNCFWNFDRALLPTLVRLDAGVSSPDTNMMLSPHEEIILP